jgi:hypothetical protein
MYNNIQIIINPAREYNESEKKSAASKLIAEFTTRLPIMSET